MTGSDTPVQQTTVATEDASYGSAGRTATQDADDVFRTDNSVVMHTSTEILVVRSRIRTQDAIFVVGHAPYSGRTKKEIQEWWIQLQKIVGRIPGNLPVISLLDSNAHFSEAAPPHIGEANLERRSSEAATHMVEYLRQTHSWAISTENHHGDSHTWVHPNGSRRRNNYICIPQEWKYPHSAISWTEPFLDVGSDAGHQDYIPLLAAFIFTTKGGFARRPATRPVDTQKIKNATQDDINAFFQGLAKAPWDTNVHEHAASIVLGIQHELGRHFGASRKPPRKEYISEETWKLRTSRVDARRRVRGLEKKIESGWLAWTFRKWTGVATGDTTGPREQQRKLIKQISNEWREIRRQGKELRTELQRDRLRALECIATEAQTAPGHLIYQRLRRVYMASKREARYNQ